MQVRVPAAAGTREPSNNTISENDFVDYELEVVENDGNENRIKCESGVVRRKEKGVYSYTWAVNKTQLKTINRRNPS
jgi:hypothetical protein